MADDIPKCPRCPNGGNVKLVKEATASDERMFTSAPAQPSKAQLFQCTCGWTLARTRPPVKRGNKEM